jgi:amino acid adenylation domain-containing protein
VSARHLAAYLGTSAARYPDRTAVVDANDRRLTYAELNTRSDALASYLDGTGVSRGDRVGMVLPKDVTAVVAIFGILKAGAAYVPVDATAPAERGRRILTDCDIRALIVDASCLDVTPQGDSSRRLSTVVVTGPITGSASGAPNITQWEHALANPGNRGNPGNPGNVGNLGNPGNPDDLAYILYTSGSTGMPKGVMISHDNAVTFIDWCSSVFAPTELDRFSSHPPFHFDPSVFDLYLSIKHGATVYLIPDELGKNPKELARFIARHRLTLWTSTPSTLILLLQFGDLAAHDCSSVRQVSFGGEVFPVKHLRSLQRLWPWATYYNMYGPTETTTICTLGRIPAAIPDDRNDPYPIGFPCDHCQTLVLDNEGREVAEGEEGLLHISGPSVSAGYWNRPEENASAFHVRDGVRWYNTGDVVRWNSAEGFTYVGRRDRMVKRRGFRIELGEIERALYLHPAVEEAAVVAVSDADAGMRIVAFLRCHADQDAPSIVELKTYCAARLPAYMSPDRFIFQERLPKTSTDKIDYQALNRQLQAVEAR